MVLLVEKVEAAYESLRQKTTDVYIQRAQQLYTIAAQRTSLLQWTLDDVSVVALADPSYSGYGNMVQVMREIDPSRLIVFDNLFVQHMIGYGTIWHNL